ncbi:MAG TPA: TonB-dependent receptor [Vicinamibacterales bacterium]|nr:TonB-dependent receptor [Vicinamibacterales bacterium]
MGRRTRVLSAAIAGLCAASAGPAAAREQQPAMAIAPMMRPAHMTAANTVAGGVVSGVVIDEHDSPLAGAMVSILGATTAMTVTDISGRFALQQLPPGEYSMRAHLPGFAASRRENVRVGASAPASFRLQLHRIESAVATTGPNEPLTARPIVAAGFSLPQVEVAPADPATDDDDHSHSETAWRLRHLTRSILKDSANTVVFADDEVAPDPREATSPGRAASFASGLFADLPFSGEVNLLTSSAFGPGELFSGNALPRGIAYLSIGAPTGVGEWAVRAGMSQGDLSSWIVAGSFLSRRDSLHSYDIGLSYSTQEYQGGNPLALAAVTDGSRNVGEVYAVDRWTPGPGVSFEYGGRYARYDYLESPGLFSPRAALTLEPRKGSRLKASLGQRMIAPGAEEFLPPSLAGPWLPPERTFSPLVGTDLRVERARMLDVVFEHEIKGTYVVGIRRFFQGIDDQAVTVFGVNMPTGSRSIGHYYVASAGGVDAQGWGVRLGTVATKRVHGSVEYTVTHGDWKSRGDLTQAPPWVASLARPSIEDIHDVTASMGADIPETSTRVFILYKLNSAYSRTGAHLTDAGTDGRFDVQVNQALPFGLGGTKWEVLLGVRNLFRDANDPGSVYDELLVVRPPKRVVGGFLVRF